MRHFAVDFFDVPPATSQKYSQIKARLRLVVASPPCCSTPGEAEDDPCDDGEFENTSSPESNSTAENLQNIFNKNPRPSGIYVLRI